MGAGNFVTRTGSTQQELPQAHFDLSLIDPRLRDEDPLNDVDVDDQELKSLRSNILLETSVLGKDDWSEVDDIQADELFLNEEKCVQDNSTDVQKQSLISAFDFINVYSKINVINKRTFARAWPSYISGKASFADSIGPCSVRGNSRDDPTPVEFSCGKTPGCPYKTIRADDLVNHEHRCSQDYVMMKKEETKEVKDFLCMHDGCSAAFSTNIGLVVHISSSHTFSPRPCGASCDPDKLFINYSAYYRHLEKEHSGKWPTRCLYPDCENDKQWVDSDKYRRHLQKDHGLTQQKERALYFPPDPQMNIKMRKVWEPTTCSMPDCTSKAQFVRISTLKKASGHGASVQS